MIMAIGKAILELAVEVGDFSNVEVAELLEQWMKEESNPHQAEIFRVAAEMVKSGQFH
ncbi:hypothetical protein [Pantoea stewartii]|uniref:hypothetical protein n=1 Tax=Pantoea stewartii TaxID=66269 RepID=UPI00386C3413